MDTKEILLELRTKRNTLWEQTKDFLEKNRGENGLVKAEAVEQYNKMAQEVKDLGAEIERLEQQAQIEASKQTVSMLVIDKKRMPLKESGLPQMVIDQTPKLLRRSKMPIVKAKVGPKISILIADEKVFDLIPVKKEIKAEVSGLYIVGVKGIRGNLDAPVKKKKGFFARFKKSAEEAQAAQNETKKSKKNKKK